MEGMADVMAGDDWTGALYREISSIGPRPQPITLIPYFAWCNRGMSEMTIWLSLGCGSTSS